MGLQAPPCGKPFGNLLPRPSVGPGPLGEDPSPSHLSSGSFASLALVMLYLGALRITHSRVASLFAVLALGISHTFWTYAVVPKAYSLTLFILSSCILLLLQWRARRTRGRIALVGLLTGLGV